MALTPEAILEHVKEVRERNPDAKFAICVVQRKWPDTKLGQKVRIVGRLTARYIGSSPHGSLVDLYLDDAEKWAKDQQRRVRDEEAQ